MGTSEPRIHDESRVNEEERHRTPKRSTIPVCVDCGYNLIGFNIGDLCPECGLQIDTLDPEISQPKDMWILWGAGSVSYISCIGGFAIAEVNRSPCNFGLPPAIPIGLSICVFALLVTNIQLIRIKLMTRTVNLSKKTISSAKCAFRFVAPLNIIGSVVLTLLVYFSVF